jgi:hypothetical protein
VHPATVVFTENNPPVSKGQSIPRYVRRRTATAVVSRWPSIRPVVREARTVARWVAGVADGPRVLLRQGFAVMLRLSPGRSRGLENKIYMFHKDATFK